MNIKLISIHLLINLNKGLVNILFNKLTKYKIL